MFDNSMSCGAAVRAKPRARLWSPGYTADKFSRAAEWRKSSLVRISLVSIMTQSPLRGSYNFHKVTQGSQSIALGLVLIAAPQLDAGARTMIVNSAHGSANRNLRPARSQTNPRAILLQWNGYRDSARCPCRFFPHLVLAALLSASPTTDSAPGIAWHCF